MNPNKALWEKGDFTQIAQTMRQSGDALVAKIGVAKGQKILDLGCGDGRIVVSAAKKFGCRAIGVDLDPKCVESARALGLDAMVGSLEPGKQADLAAFPMPSVRPGAAGAETSHEARLVVVAGRELVNNGRLVTPCAGLPDRIARTSAALAQWRTANPAG